MRTLAATLLLLGLCIAAPGDSVTCDYRRDIGSPEGVLRALRNLAIRRDAESVLVVFDTITFSPPPGWHEYSFTHDFKGDLPGWLDAFESVSAPGDYTFYAATTLAAEAHEVGSKDFRNRIEGELLTNWWDRKDFREFPPATAWISRLLSRIPGSKKMLVLVTGEIPPESWADHSLRLSAPQRWRRKLPDPGKYWDEEAVGALVRSRGATLDIVSPEVRFGDFLPFTDLPEAPWAARPALPPGRDTASAEQLLDPENEEAVARLAEALRPHHPDLSDEELRAKAREFLTAARKARTPGHETVSPVCRFYSLTPVFLPHYGSYTFHNTDSLSRFGYWPYARAVTKAGGEYIFYPFPPADFRDRCPYDSLLLRRLAPGYASREQEAVAYRGDAALQALCRATAIVQDRTPWSDGSAWFRGRAKSTGWFAFRSATPLTFEKRYRERNKPFDWVHDRARTVEDWRRYGRSLQELPALYDRAIAILDEAGRRISAGKAPRPHRRSMANLRLTRFWFEMSAFHLAALSLYLTEIEKHVDPAIMAARGELLLAYIPTIRMSDCLPGYEGKVITAELEEQFDTARQPGRSPWWDRCQSNLLTIPLDHECYRAIRHPARVLKRLDSRLKSRALRLIDAAAEVMRHEGRSPWGWVVYYSDAFTFIYESCPPRGPGERPGKEEDPPDGSTTPRPSPRARGPSTGG